MVTVLIGTVLRSSCVLFSISKQICWWRFFSLTMQLKWAINKKKTEQSLECRRKQTQPLKGKLFIKVLITFWCRWCTRTHSYPITTATITDGIEWRMKKGQKKPANWLYNVAAFSCISFEHLFGERAISSNETRNSILLENNVQFDRIGHGV